jgi:hypothetical protein
MSVFRWLSSIGNRITGGGLRALFNRLRDPHSAVQKRMELQVLQGSELFDPAYYLTTYPDVAKAGVNPAVHYFESGALEGRDPSPDFDTSFYLATYPDVAATGINPLVHFLQIGAQEGRSPHPSHWRIQMELQTLQRSGLFDEEFYCACNPDVVAGRMTPIEHFLRVGAFEGRRPNPLFDPACYLTIYPDVANVGINPALHYFESGSPF